MADAPAELWRERVLMAIAVVLSLPALLGYPSLVLAVALTKRLSVPPHGLIGTVLGMISFLGMMFAPLTTVLLLIVMVLRRPRSRGPWILTLAATSLVVITWMIW